MRNEEPCDYIVIFLLIFILSRTENLVSENAVSLISYLFVSLGECSVLYTILYILVLYAICKYIFCKYFKYVEKVEYNVHRNTQSVENRIM